MSKEGSGLPWKYSAFAGLVLLAASCGSEASAREPEGASGSVARKVPTEQVTATPPQTPEITRTSTPMPTWTPKHRPTLEPTATPTPKPTATPELPPISPPCEDCEVVVKPFGTYAEDECGRTLAVWSPLKKEWVVAERPELACQAFPETEKVPYYGFTQFQYEILQEAATFMAKHLPERMQKFDDSVKMVKRVEGTGGYALALDGEIFLPDDLFQLSTNREALVFIVSVRLYAHEVEHIFQEERGQGPLQVCNQMPEKAQEMEIGPRGGYVVEKEIAQELYPNLSPVAQAEVDGYLHKIDLVISGQQPIETCLSGS